jgi:xylulokinase
MRATLVIDVGTQGSKAGVYSLDGELLGEGYAEHTFDHLRPGWVEMDPDQITHAVVTAAATAVAAANMLGVAERDIVGVALSGILCGPVFVDADWRPVRPLIPFLDTRCTDEVAWIGREIEPRWVHECGNASLDTYVTPAVLEWVRRNEPDTYARIRKVLSLAPYVGGRLAGLRTADAYLDPSHLSGWIIGWNAATRDFSDQQLQDLGVPREFCPTVKRPTDIIGALSASYAEQIGLPAGIPIACGAGDVMQSNLSAGLVRPGMATDVAGTASILTVGVQGIHPSVTAVPGMLYSLATIEGQSLYWGYVKAGGLSLRWFRDELLHEHGVDAVYTREDVAAQDVSPGSDGVLFAPYLSGGNPDNPNAAGTWIGMTAGTNRSVLWRSMLESIAFEYADFLDVFAREGIGVGEVLAVGGGARSALWNQMKADVIGVPWTTPSRGDGAPLANAALAAVAVGERSDLASTITSWVTSGSVFHPVDETHARYRSFRKFRNEVFDGPLRTAFDRLADLRSSL